jgi:hypothetical protein
MIVYLRRTAKYFLYMAAIFALVLYLIPLMTGQKSTFNWGEFSTHRQSMILLLVLVGYGLVYPLTAFVKTKRYLNGTFAENREIFEKAFETMNFIKTEETPERIVYRRKSGVVRFLQWYEDAIIVEIAENPVIISGFRKSVVRIERFIDQLIMMKSAE